MSRDTRNTPRLLRRFSVASICLIALACREPIANSNVRIAQIDYDVRISDPASGLVHVRATVACNSCADMPSLRLEFRDLKRTPSALKRLTAVSGDVTLQIEAGREEQSDVRSIYLNGSLDPTIIEYTVDPTFYPPGSKPESPADARARVTDSLAVLRSSSFIPIIGVDSLQARVRFSLPPYWVVVAPWAMDSTSYVLTTDDIYGIDYIGLGSFEVQTIKAGNAVFSVSAPPGRGGLAPGQAAAIIQYYLKHFGPPPLAADAQRSLVLVPTEFMRGGAAGSRSIVQGSSVIVLAHEVFHWWMHSGLVLPEAGWFTEGVTNYYAIRAATETGLLTEEQQENCLADLEQEMRYLESGGSRSLAVASAEYRRDNKAQRLVYAKGTLFAYLLRREFSESDRGLDAVIKDIVSGPRQGLSNRQLRDFFEIAYGPRATKIFDAIVTGGNQLPALGLDSATGTSGCARYLPEN